MSATQNAVTNMGSTPIDNLELRAMEQRAHLHYRAAELKEKIDETREDLSPATQARRHFTPAAVGASVVGLLMGFAFTGIFTQK